MSLDELTTPPISIGSSSLTIEEPNIATALCGYNVFPKILFL